MHEDVCAGFGRSVVLNFYAQFLERRNGHELKPRLSVPEILKVLRENQPQRLFVITLHEDAYEFLNDFFSNFLSDSGRSGAENYHVVIFWQQVKAMCSFGSSDKHVRRLAVLVFI